MNSKLILIFFTLLAMITSSSGPASAASMISLMDAGAPSSQSAAASVQVRRVGTVTEYTPGQSITIVDRNNRYFAFTLASTLKIVPSSRANLLGVGAYVTVIAPANSPNNKLIAVGIVVHRGASVTATPSNTPTNTATKTPTKTPTNTPTVTPTRTPSNTPTNTATFTPTNTPTITPTSTFTFTPTATPEEEPPEGPSVPPAKPSMTDPESWDPPYPLGTIIGYTFPIDMPNWTIPLRVAPFAQIPAPDEDGLTAIGMVAIGLSPITLKSEVTSINSRVSWSDRLNKGMALAPEVQRVGLVIAYLPGQSLTIVDKDGDPYRFELSSPLKIVPTNRASSLGLGSFVTVIAPNNSEGGKLVATGIVIHPSVPKNFPVPTAITYVVKIDLSSSDAVVPGKLVSVSGSDTLNVSFERIPQILNMERFGSPYPELDFDDSMPETGASISATNVCFLANMGDEEEPAYNRYCSTDAPAITLGLDRSARQSLPWPLPALQITSTTPLSVSTTYSSQYSALQTAIRNGAPRIPFPIERINLNAIISTIEDPARLEACAASELQTDCSSDIIIAPVTEAFFNLQNDDIMSRPLPLSRAVNLTAGVARVLLPITLPSGDVVRPGDYKILYWFDTNRVFYAATLTGHTGFGAVSDSNLVTGQRIPAVPALLLNANDTEFSGAQISGCRMWRRCTWFQRTCN